MKSVLAAAIALFLLSVWIVVPAPVLLLLPLGVVVPELSPILMIVTLVFGGLMLLARNGQIKKVALSLAVMTVAICTVPLAGVPLPLSVMLGGLVRGIDAGNARVVSGVEFARPDGHPLTLTIYRPTSSGRFPILVQIYGGVWQRGTPNDDSLFARVLCVARSRRVRDRLSARATMEVAGANPGCSFRAGVDSRSRS